MKSGSAKELFDAYNGTAPGFDALRLILSMTIMLWHTVFVCYGADNPVYAAVWSHPVVQPILRSILPSFFFLGGFLVTGSAYRLKKTAPFLMFRILRIFPALLVEVALSAVILGGLLTTLPLSAYYTHSQFYAYFLNIFGVIHFQLPEVFAGNPRSIVNINLWTLPPDFHGYALMAVLIGAGIIFNRRVFFAVFILASIFIAALLPVALSWGAHGSPFVHSYLLIYSFFLGALAYVFSDKIQIKKHLMFLSVLGLLFFESNITTILGVFAACYLTLCIGFMDLRRFPLIKRGDYSYGIYLYGCPIEQAVWHYIPAAREWWLLYVIALPVTFIFAALSWHWIEKPFLGLKRKMAFLRTPQQVAACALKN
jgi:peptidoglycan/LPS O-acetylase OafA/YrhL